MDRHRADRLTTTPTLRDLSGPRFCAADASIRALCAHPAASATRPARRAPLRLKRGAIRRTSRVGYDVRTSRSPTLFPRMSRCLPARLSAIGRKETSRRGDRSGRALTVPSSSRLTLAYARRSSRDQVVSASASSSSNPVVRGTLAQILAPPRKRQRAGRWPHCDRRTTTQARRVSCT